MARPRVFVIGDSISIQYGPFLERGLRGMCDYSRKSGEEEALINLDVPRGGNGGDSSMVRSFLEAMADSPAVVPYELLLVNCGLHDIKRDPESGEFQVSIDDYSSNLRAIVRAGRRVGNRFVWVRTTPVDDAMHAKRGCGFTRVQADVDLYNATADTAMAEEGVQAIDLAAFTHELSVAGQIFRDGVHFLPPVQEQQGAYIAGWIAGGLTAGLLGQG